MTRFTCLLLFLSVMQARAQLRTDSLLVKGIYRTFHFYSPSKKIDNGSLMFIMHGSGGNGKQMIKHTTGLERMAQKENLIVVYPNGYKTFWNECRKFATSETNQLDIDENEFFASLIDYFHANYGVSKNKVVAAGFSGGGHMAYKLGLTMPGKIKAIAAVVANMPDSASCDCQAKAKSLPVLIVNGTDDNVNPWNGGEMFVNNTSYGVVRSSTESFRYWARLAGYSGQPSKNTLADTDPGDKKSIVAYSYEGEGKPTVTLLEVKGGRHDYPSDIDLWVYVWQFFYSNVREIAISKANPAKPVRLVDAACGQCQFGLQGKSCDLAVRIDGKAYFVDGTSIDDHGDAHAADGFCEAVRKAKVQGQVEGGRFKATYLELIRVSK